MCGRYVLVTPPEELAGYFDAKVAPGVATGFRSSWNVSPSSEVLAVASEEAGERVVDRYRWGLVPSWAKDPAIGQKTFNARAETVAVKPAFRAAFAHRRLAVLADGYWEWRKEPGGVRQPFYFHRPDGHPLALAGLYERWRDPRRGDDPDSWVRTCTVITTDASSDLAAVHDRMPAILAPGALDVWLAPGRGDREELEGLLRPVQSGELEFYPVGRGVGNPRNDGPELLERVEIDGGATG